MKIITLTLNPAFDLHLSADGFKPYGESVARVTDRDAGGKGVNISRALTAYGVENEALILLGEENADEFRKCLENEQIRYTGATLRGRIRENITLHTEGKPETRISFEGFVASDVDLENILRVLETRIDGDSIVTFTGSLPRGVTHGGMMALLSGIKALGARLVIDSHAVSRDDIISLKPWLIKPNGEEASAYIGREADSPTEALEGARLLRESGVENVMVTLGGAGALLVTKDGAYIAEPPSITPLSTVGAGDSTVAGFIAAMARGESAAECFRLGVAFGTAACLTRGTNPPKNDDVLKILNEIKITKI